jgi:phage gpG-like protein
MTYKIEVTGLEETKQHLRGLAVHLASFWPEVWDEVSASISVEEALWFESHGDGSWTPLSPAYAAYKSVVLPGQPILVASGELRSSLTDPAQLVLEITPDALFLGSRVSYARYHQEGTENMPARPVLIPAIRVWDIIDSVVKRQLGGGRFNPRSWMSYGVL